MSEHGASLSVKKLRKLMTNVILLRNPVIYEILC